MTVENQNPINTFVSDGVKTTYILDFVVESKDYLKVQTNNLTVSKHDYSFNKNNNTLTFYNSLAKGSNIAISRVTELERANTFETFINTFRPESLNYDFDRIWKALQEAKIENADMLGTLIKVLDSSSDADRLILENLFKQTESDIDQNNKIVELLREEVTKRVGDDAANDFIIQLQQDKHSDELKKYIDQILSIKNPNLVGGVTSRMVIDHETR